MHCFFLNTSTSSVKPFHSYLTIDDRHSCILLSFMNSAPTPIYRSMWLLMASIHGSRADRGLYFTSGICCLALCKVLLAVRKKIDAADLSLWVPYCLAQRVLGDHRSIRWRSHFYMMCLRSIWTQCVLFWSSLHTFYTYSSIGTLASPNSTKSPHWIGLKLLST